MTQHQSISLCACGCGQPAPLAKRTRPYLGHVEGQPLRYATGHYWRGKKRPERKLPAAAQAEADERRLFRKFLIGDGCWEWTGARFSANGYGAINIGGRVKHAHRVFYEMRVGPVPQGLELHHTCENKGCVRPDHLMPLTRKQHHLADGRHERLKKGLTTGMRFKK